MLTITLLGTAATMPLPDRALTAAVAECGGHSLLFDCGEGTQTAARRAGVNLMKMDAVCLTHYHGDHIFGLPGLLQTLGCQGRTRPLALEPAHRFDGAGLAHLRRYAGISRRPLCRHPHRGPARRVGRRTLHPHRRLPRRPADPLQRLTHRGTALVGQRAVTQHQRPAQSGPAAGEVIVT